MRSHIATAAAAAAIAVFGAYGSTVTTAAAGHSAPSGAARTAAGPPGPVRQAGVIPAGLHVALAGAALSAAASRCAAWGTEAGFAKNGYLGGSLTTAVAVALAESGCNPVACYDDTTGHQCTRPGTRHSRDNIDRGAWQINSKAWRDVRNSCAYHGLCNAQAAYRQASAWGTYFAPWTTYLTDHFAPFLWAAQHAVNDLRRGTLTSALIGSCAAYPADRPGARVVLSNCGSASADQQWTLGRGKLRTSGGLCLGAASGHRGAAVILRRCSGSRLVRWSHDTGALLKNQGARQCLTDPGSSLTPGHGLAVGACAEQQNEGWFRP